MITRPSPPAGNDLKARSERRVGPGVGSSVRGARRPLDRADEPHDGHDWQHDENEELEREDRHQADHHQQQDREAEDGDTKQRSKREQSGEGGEHVSSTMGFLNTTRDAGRLVSAGGYTRAFWIRRGFGCVATADSRTTRAVEKA